MAPRLSQRTVLVVGAGTQASDEPDAPIGNGRAIAVLAARAGAHVVCVDRDANAAPKVSRVSPECLLKTGTQYPCWRGLSTQPD